MNGGFPTLDSDADVIAAYRDNCPFAYNPTQVDSGGILSLDPDGIGDACQCADVNDDGFVDYDDFDAYRDSLADPVGLGLTPAGVAKCSVIDGPGPCEVVDVSVIAEGARASAAPARDRPGLHRRLAAALARGGRLMGRTLWLALAPFWILVALLGATPRDVLSAVPAAVNHQGLLLDTLGEPLDGTVDLAVRIWGHPTSIHPSLQLYVEDHLATPVVDGVYSIEIGTGTDPTGPFSAALFAGPDRWLELMVNEEVMAPRQRLLSVAYALQAEICADSATLGGLTSASIITTAQSSIPFSNLTGVIADSQVPASFTRDAEVVPLVLASDGPGSGLNADFLDGISSASFSQLGPTIESIEITDLTVATADLADTSVTAAKLADGVGSGVDADLFDGLESSSFLRRNLSDTYTGTLLTVATSTTVDMNGTLRIGQFSNADNDSILFDQANESLTWNEVGSRFEMSDEFRANAFSLTAPIIRSLRIPGNTFVANHGQTFEGTWENTTAGYGFPWGPNSSEFFQLAAAVNLPAGATITGFSCSRYLGSGTDGIDGDGSLTSRTGTSTALTTHATVNLDLTTTSSAVQIVTDTTITSPVVSDAADYWIGVNFQTDVVGIAARFYGCSVQFDLTTLEP